MTVNTPPIRVIVSSGAAAVRAGLRELLTAAGFEVVRALAVEALLDAPLDEVDVVVIDLGGDDALIGVLEAELAELPVVVLAERTAGGSEPAARAWLTEDASEDALAAAVSAVAAGLTVYAPELAPEPTTSPVLGGALDGEVAPITDREQDVLELLAAGLPNKGIALQLGISEHTVKFHVGSLLSKLEAQSRTEAVTIAARQGLLSL